MKHVCASNFLLNRLTTWREDRDRETGARLQSQRVQSVRPVESRVARRRVRVEFKHCADDGVLRRGPKLHPTTAPGRNHDVEPSRMFFGHAASERTITSYDKVCARVAQESGNRKVGKC
jgi:hypothetical protein